MFYDWNNGDFREGIIIVIYIVGLHQPILFSYVSALLDFNECHLNNAGCEQVCNNTEGSYNCNCRKGFKLKPDKMGCEGKTIGPLHNTVT